jgi:diguanylate cyclase (GGDEF)-like protein
LQLKHAQSKDEGRVVVDVTDRSAAADLLPVGVLLAQPNGRVGAVNRAWCELSGLTRAASGGFGWLVGLQAIDRNDALSRVRDAAERGIKGVVDYRLDVAGQSRWARWWICGSGDPSMPVAMAVADVEADHEVQERLRHEATYDALTGLMLRRPFFALLDHALRQNRHFSRPSVLYVDLDNFKEINDAHGHIVGDELLVTFAGALTGAVRPEDMVARVGGDEFAVLCSTLEASEDAVTIAGRIDAALALPLSVKGLQLRAAASIGIAIAEPGDDPQKLLERADRAMYQAKRMRLAARQLR